MPKIRVLIVDDSVVIRRLLTEILSAEQDFEVVGGAANASLALAKIEQSTPDIVILDVEMPEMSGLDLLTEIAKRGHKLRVIMFSSLTQRAAATTLEALARGAADYVTKPSGTGSREASVDLVRSQLVPKIRALAPSSYDRRTTGSNRMSVAPGERAFKGAPFGVVAVGSSTGGPNALAELFRLVPATFELPIVIVQHMPPLFTRLLAERLTESCPLQFREASAGDVLEPGRAFIAPGDHHLRVVREGARVKLALDQGPQENSCRPAVDVLFRSIADVFAEKTLAIVLTGMGQDGLRGAELIRARGGRILVQDEASSVVWGMPGFIARAGLADAALPLPELAAELIRHGQRIRASEDQLRAC
ncbi:MAG TPA: chemotaxis response regulator protein-glutamate methylesterase [Polyangiaceae bacterium]|nr:chemotaxis response regulator protein-glutamate methylesterase [Polyangiaceae bacterium]